MSNLICQARLSDLPAEVASFQGKTLVPHNRKDLDLFSSKEFHFLPYTTADRTCKHSPSYSEIEDG